MKQKKRNGFFLFRLFNNQKISVKLLVAFILAAFIPIIAIQVISYSMNSRSISQKIDEIMLINLKTISEQVKLKLEVYKSAVHQIQTNSEIIKNLPLLSGTPQQQAAAYREITATFRQYHSTIQGIRSIGIVCLDGSNVIYDAQTGSSLDNIWRDAGDLRELDVYKNALETSGAVIAPTMRFKEVGGEAYLFHLSRAVYDLDNVGSGPVAVVILSINEAELSALCNNVAAGDKSIETSLNFITDEERNIISYPDPFFTGIRLDEKHSMEDFVVLTRHLMQKERGVNFYLDAATGWVYYNVYDADYVLRDLKTQQTIFLVVGLLLLCFSGLLVFFITRKINRSVRAVVEGIQQVQAGNLNVSVPVFDADEIGEIAENFNEMTGKVKQSITDVKVASANQRTAEIRALEAQINPHFMYNTLDSINWMAIDKREYGISRALRDFGVILRYSISKSNEEVAVWEVADWIEKYVSLNQMRFVDVFDFHLNLDERVRDVQIHKLLLQPFVENAILHGFKGVEGGGILRVDINLSDDEKSLVILVEDNGRGMSAELARQFNEMEGSVEASKQTGIGIMNVFYRLRMYYGAGAHWNITSINKLGTIVTLVIPLLRSNNKV